jgi:tRNA dimethylallyltransferase
MLVVLGPTASGKTSLGVRLAMELGGEIISADSRQVYRGLDIGAGKDLEEYLIDGVRVPHHLIDVADLDREFSVFDFQQQSYQAFEEITGRNALPVMVGGTGLYIQSVLSGYRMVEVSENPGLRDELGKLSDEQLEDRLRSLKDRLHNVTDLESRERVIRAIEIAEAEKRNPPPPAPDIRPLVLGTRFPKDELHRRIKARLSERMENGLIEEVEKLSERRVGWERLYSLGLEYRFVAERLQGKIKNRNDLFQKLYGAICKFAKRQGTWFRRMEREGIEIKWIDRGDFDQARRIVGGFEWFHKQ